MAAAEDQLEGSVFQGSLRQGAGDKTYMYSSGNSYILSYIVQQLEGKTCRELIQERIGSKIGLGGLPMDVKPRGRLLRRQRRIPDDGTDAAHRPAVLE